MSEKILQVVNHFNLNVSETKRHIKSVKRLTKQFLEKLADDFPDIMNDSYKQAVIHASMLHDIGKASIPKPILYKKGSLNEIERMIIETHPITGMYLLKKVLHKIDLNYSNEENQVIANVILYHHEKWDGTGYPNAIKGEQIPLESRIIAIVDVFDALTSKRSYKEAWGEEEALNYLSDEKGTTFDPVLVQHFLDMKRKSSKLLH